VEKKKRREDCDEKKKKIRRTSDLGFEGGGYGKRRPKEGSTEIDPKWWVSWKRIWRMSDGVDSEGGKLERSSNSVLLLG